jgi:hypothetical protein
MGNVPLSTRSVMRKTTHAHLSLGDDSFDHPCVIKGLLFRRQVFRRLSWGVIVQKVRKTVYEFDQLDSIESC